MTLTTAASLGLQVEPAPIIRVSRESAILWRDPPRTWRSRTKLRAPRPLGPDIDFPAVGSLVPASLVVRHNGRTLERGGDYQVDERWAALALTDTSALPDGAVVEMDYAFSHRRLDAWVRRPDGTREVRPGVADITTPPLPIVQPPDHHLANIFVDYSQTAADAEVFPIELGSDQVITKTRAGRLRRAVAKLRAGKPVKIVCWGDSVTGGGDTTSPDMAYPRQFERRLRAQYPQARLTVEIIAVGGSESRNWITPHLHPHPTRQAECDWSRVADARPDVVSIEFVNDAQFTSAENLPIYHEILRRLDALGCEPLIITPHFTGPGWMHFQTLRDAECRPYVHDLLTLAADRHLAVADVSSRWAALWRQGIPYTVLLRNSLNHPEDRGHGLFADELIKCFA